MMGAAGLTGFSGLESLERGGWSAAEQGSVILGRCAGERPMSPYRLRISFVVISEELLNREESFRMDCRSSGT